MKLDFAPKATQLPDMRGFGNREPNSQIGPALSFTAIIPTKDRPNDLICAVDSTLKQSVLPVQIIIVDQSSTRESRRLIEERFAAAPPHIQATVKLSYIHDTTISGLASARNRAMEIAQGDVWIFLDDDVCLEHDF